MDFIIVAKEWRYEQELLWVRNVSSVFICLIIYRERMLSSSIPPCISRANVPPTATAPLGNIFRTTCTQDDQGLAPTLTPPAPRLGKWWIFMWSLAQILWFGAKVRKLLQIPLWNHNYRFVFIMVFHFKQEN